MTTMLSPARSRPAGALAPTCGCGRACSVRPVVTRVAVLYTGYVECVRRYITKSERVVRPPMTGGEVEGVNFLF